MTQAPRTPMMIDGRSTAAAMRAELGERIARLAAAGVKPGLAVILVGDDPASAVYVGQKEKACRETGLASMTWRLPGTTAQAELLSLVGQLNGRGDVHAILIQLPLPRQMDTQEVIAAIDPEKDADGLHPVNLGRLLAGQAGFLPCTPHGVMKLLERHRIPVAGREAVIVGRSTLVGKPLALLLLREHATVTLCHSRTQDLASHTRRADILVAAAGKAGLITGPMVREGAVVVDVGTNRGPDGKLVGDVVYGEVAPRASAITPVPGGVGPMTITMLLYNTVLAAERSSGRNR